MACPDAGSLLDALQQEGPASPYLSLPRGLPLLDSPGLGSTRSQDSVRMGESELMQRVLALSPRGWVVRTGFKPCLCVSALINLGKLCPSLRLSFSP